MSIGRMIKSAFESMMFVWGEPLEAKLAGEIFNISAKEAYEYFKELQKEYENDARGIRVREVDNAFHFVTSLENSEDIERLCTPKKQRRLSQSALEVLAIIAYKQPITRGEIEAIRGIKCDRVVEGLAAKGLVEEAGRSPGIGRPVLFGTTRTFLEYFNFETLNELPDIDDFAKQVEIEDSGEEFDTRQIRIEMLGSGEKDGGSN